MSGRWKRACSLQAPRHLSTPHIVLYITDAVESINYSPRKVMQNCLSFSNADVAMKLVYMALQNISANCTMLIKDWSQALNQFAIMFNGRVPL